MSLTAFELFCKERVCALRDGYVEVVNEKVTLKDLFKAWNRWRLERKTVKKISQEEFKEKCDDRFQKTNQEGIYQHLRVFLDPDDHQEFIQECEALRLKTDSEPTISSEMMADQILANPNRKELVRGLIEDKRRLYGDCEELEAKIDTLETETLRLKSALREVSALLLQIPNLVSVLLDPIKHPQSNIHLLQTLPGLSPESSTASVAQPRVTSDRSALVGQSDSLPR